MQQQQQQQQQQPQPQQYADGTTGGTAQFLGAGASSAAIRRDTGIAQPNDEVMALLEASLRSLPPPSDAVPSSNMGIMGEERKDYPVDSQFTGEYQPKYPYAVPDSFPQMPASEFDDSSLFEKFDVDSLFFIFYYQQGTYAQFLAARELKKQGWRFHKKYLTWLQRHNEPKIVTDEYEQGTFVYFDYETGWCQRIKSDFVFEYSFLENDVM
jgi:CCR4-NOT transcription complex subunit 3